MNRTHRGKPAVLLSARAHFAPAVRHGEILGAVRRFLNARGNRHVLSERQSVHRSERGGLLSLLNGFHRIFPKKERIVGKRSGRGMGALGGGIVSDFSRFHESVGRQCRPRRRFLSRHPRRTPSQHEKLGRHEDAGKSVILTSKNFACPPACATIHQVIKHSKKI